MNSAIQLRLRSDAMEANGHGRDESRPYQEMIEISCPFGCPEEDIQEAFRTFMRKNAATIKERHTDRTYRPAVIVLCGDIPAEQRTRHTGDVGNALRSIPHFKDAFQPSLIRSNYRWSKPQPVAVDEIDW